MLGTINKVCMLRLGERVKVKAYTYCLKRYFLLSKSVHGEGVQKSVTFDEHTYFMDDPLFIHFLIIY